MKQDGSHRVAANPHCVAAGSGQVTAGHRRVVVGVDGSENSVAALHLAVTQARRRHAELDVIHVVPPDADEAEVSDGAAMLAALVGREFPLGPGVEVRRRVERGDPAPILLGASADADLLVLGGREDDGHSRLFGSRTVGRCLEHGRCPVEVCR